MNTWYSLNLGDEPEAYDVVARIKEILTPLIYAALGSYEMAAFYKDDPQTHIVTAYFPPATHEIAMLFNATPCEKPSKEGLVVIVGDQRTLEFFYPAIE